MDTAQQLIKDICVNYNSAEKCIAENKTSESAQYIRAALENAVTLFWSKKNLGAIPIKNGKIDLVSAIADSRFRFNFFDMTISDMQGIRQVSANVIANTTKLTPSEARDILARLKKCIEAISEKLGINILNSSAESPFITDTTIEIKPMTETQKFWAAFNELLMENGEPFNLTIDDDSAVITKNDNANLTVTFNPTQKYFTVGIYTSNRMVWNTLSAHKAEINSQLAQKPTWGSTTSACYVQIKSASAFYDNIPYAQLIESMLEDTETYIDIFNKYSLTEDSTMLPKGFSDQLILPHPLVVNLKRGFGGRAQSIYDAGCNTFGWDKSKRGNFSMMKILYATHATPEGHSVWFLCNIAQKVVSDNGIRWPIADATFAKGKNWANFLLADGSLIYEVWKDIGPAFPGYRDDTTKRVTFLKFKDTNSDYAFAGIYEPVKLEDKIVNGKVYHIKVYERIAETYGE